MRDRSSAAPVVVRVFVLVALAVVARAGLLCAQERAVHRVSGIVFAVPHSPIPDAQVQLDQAGAAKRSVRTGADGRFAFENLKAGDVTIQVRRLGYTPRSVVLSVGDDDTGPLEIRLEQAATELTDVVVEADNSRLREFNDRRRAHGTGTFMTYDEIQRLHPRLSSDVFRRIPGASLRTSPRFGNMIRLRGCRPTVWIDGIAVRGAELDEVSDPAEIAGLEVYTSLSVPPEYADRDSRPCGVILVWTRLR